MMEDSYVETKVEALQDNRTKVTVTVDAKDIDARIKKTYKDFAYKYNFPGFRRGKAPRPVIDNALGKEAVRATVTDDLVNGCYPLAIDDCRLYPVGKPEFDETDLVEGGKPYTFAFTVAVKPELELSSYEPVEIKLPAEGASDKADAAAHAHARAAVNNGVTNIGVALKFAGKACSKAACRRTGPGRRTPAAENASCASSPMADAADDSRRHQQLHTHAGAGLRHIEPHGRKVRVELLRGFEECERTEKPEKYGALPGA